MSASISFKETFKNLYKNICKKIWVYMGKGNFSPLKLGYFASELPVL